MEPCFSQIKSADSVNLENSPEPFFGQFMERSQEIASGSVYQNVYSAPKLYGLTDGLLAVLKLADVADFPLDPLFEAIEALKGLVQILLFPREDHNVAPVVKEDANNLHPYSRGAAAHKSRLAFEHIRTKSMHKMLQYQANVDLASKGYKIKKVVGNRPDKLLLLLHDQLFCKRVAAALGSREVAVLRQLRGRPHFLELVDCVETQQHIYIITEYIKGQHLSKYYGSIAVLPQSEKRCLFSQMVEAVQELHSLQLVHLDIKPQNILIRNQSQLVLADFQLTRAMGQPLQPLQGTLHFMAPQLYSHTVAQFCNDVWSLGVTLTWIVSGRTPWQLQNNPPQDHKTLQESPNLQGISQFCEDLIRGMLNPEAESRLTLKQISQHVWLFLNSSKDFKCSLYQRISVIKQHSESFNLQKELVVLRRQNRSLIKQLEKRGGFNFVQLQRQCRQLEREVVEQSERERELQRRVRELRQVLCL